MFTGIVRDYSTLIETRSTGLERCLRFGTGLAKQAEVGCSIAVNGVCLTVVVCNGTEVTMTAVPETLSRTTLGELVVGDLCNLEPALRVGDPLGGHWVSGHVDRVIEVVGVTNVGEGREVMFSLPQDVARYLVDKGSVCLDGISLTVAHIQTQSMQQKIAESTASFSVALIPHTLRCTTAQRWSPGVRVNLEVDMMGKYVERLLAWTRGQP